MLKDIRLYIGISVVAVLAALLMAVLLAVTLYTKRPQVAQTPASSPSVAASSTSSADLVSSTSPDKMLALMQGEGYSVTKEGQGIIWKIDGKRSVVLVSQSGNGLLFMTAFSDGNATPEKINAWNKTKRYSRTYLDDEGDPVLEVDLDLEGGVSHARVLDYLKTCRVSLAAWTQEVIR